MGKYSMDEGEYRQLTSNPTTPRTPSNDFWIIPKILAGGFVFTAVLVVLDVLDMTRVIGVFLAIISLIIIGFGLITMRFRFLAVLGALLSKRVPCPSPVVSNPVAPKPAPSTRKKPRYTPEMLEELFHTSPVISRNAALETLDELRQYNLLEKGILRTIRLSGLDLHGVDLSFIDVQGGQVAGVNLSGATLSFSNLSGANLQGSDLRGADLRHALLLDADLQDVQFDETTVLPDGTGWTPHVDTQRFTDQAHPESWVPEWYGKKLEQRAWFNYQNKEL